MDDYREVERAKEARIRKLLIDVEQAISELPYDEIWKERKKIKHKSKNLAGLARSILNELNSPY